MPLADVDISIDRRAVPREVAAFLREADSRINQFFRSGPAPSSGFVPSDFVAVYHALCMVAEARLVPGNSFCEWGSGFGVVASLAATLEFSACGIEIERSLVDASRSLAGDFGLPVEFIHGSFIPRGGEAIFDGAYVENNNDEVSWMTTYADDAYDELGRNPDDFDLTYAYPWPGDECAIETLFERYAAEGAMLLTHNKYHCVRFQRKVR